MKTNLLFSKMENLRTNRALVGTPIETLVSHHLFNWIFICLLSLQILNERKVYFIGVSSAVFEAVFIVKMIQTVSINIFIRKLRPAQYLLSKWIKSINTKYRFLEILIIMPDSRWDEHHWIRQILLYLFTHLF